jgi:hypothetical protein
LVTNGNEFPAGQQLALAVERADAPDDQPLIAQRRLGDLRDAGRRVVSQRVPGALGDLLDRRAHAGLQAHPDRVARTRALEAGEDGSAW